MTARITFLLSLACAALPGCGGEPGIEGLLAAHARTQPPHPATLRLVHELRVDDRRARVVTSIRSEPFAYREDTIPLEPPGPASTKVSDGRLAWRPRPGLPGEPLEGDQVRGFLVRAFLEGRLYLRPDWRTRASEPVPGRLPADAGLPQELARARDILQIDCPTAAALTVRLQFDADDHRLVGCREPHMDREAFTRYGGWRRHGRLLLPGLRLSAWKNPDRRQTFTLQEVQLEPALDDALFAGRPETGGPGEGGALTVAAGSLPGTAWILAEESWVNGRSVGPAVLDTGASSSAVAPALADELRLPRGGAFTVGAFVERAWGYKCWIDHLRWGPRRAFQVTAVTGNLPLSPAILPTRTPRVLLGGEELLADGPVFDLKARRLYYRGTPVPRLRAPGGADVVEVQARRGSPGSPRLHVPIRVRGVELLALFDSGYGGTLFLTPGAADKAGVPRRFDQVRAGPAFAQEVGGFGPETREDLMLRLPAFELGPLRFSDVWVQVQMEPGTDDGRRSYEALVGAGTLLPFPQIGIDTDRDVLEFALPPGVLPGPDGTVDVPSPGTFSGIFFQATGEDRPPAVRAIMPGSPADRAGLRVGDRVVTVDADLVASQDLPYLLQRTWLQPGRKVVLNVFRNGEAEPRRFVLRADG